MNRIKVLEMVRSRHGDVLEPGESFLTAFQVVRRHGSFRSGRPAFVVDPARYRANPPDLEIPEQSIWAVTDRRLVVWSTDRWNRKIRGLLASLPYATDVTWMVVTPKEDAPLSPAGKTYVDLGIRGRNIELEIPIVAISDLLRAIDGRVPLARPD